MKKTFYLCAAALAMATMSCGGVQTNNNQNNEGENQDQQTEEADEFGNEESYPWVFPEGQKNGELKEGETVLSIHSFYPNKIKESDDPANETYIYYNATLKSVGEKKSMVDNVEMPNSLIIPIPEGQTAKKGDIVLTWWQSGSGMQRAIVTDDSNPKQPKVCYLDMDWTEDGKGFANSHANEQLKPNSFVVLKDGEMTPGQPIYIEGDYTKLILLSAHEKYTLCKGFAGKIGSYYSQYVKLVPLHQKLQPGDKIRADFVGTYNDGYTVEKVDETIGRVWAKDSFDKTKIFSILDVLKE